MAIEDRHEIINAEIEDEIENLEKEESEETQEETDAEPEYIDTEETATSILTLLKDTLIQMAFREK